MKHFSFKLTEKYTISLLDLFNDLYIEYIKSTGDSEYLKVPLQFRSKERALNLTDQETEELIKGNTSIIPRLSLVLNGINKAPERTTNKYLNSHEIKTPTGKQFTLNSIPYNWDFSLILLCRTITESTQIIEQIAPMFRPNYTLNINEMPIISEPTTIPLELLDISTDINDDFDENDIRTINTTFNFTLRGNMYLPINDAGIIETVNIYLNEWFSGLNEYQKSVLITQTGDYSTKEIEDVKTIDLRPIISKNDPSVVPVIDDIIIPDNIKVHDTVSIKPKFHDLDNTGDKFAYVWTITRGTISNGSYEAVYTATSAGVCNITLTIIDYHGNQSTPFTKSFNVIP